MSEPLSRTLGHLEALVSFDTQNPPRAIDADGIFAYLQAQLTGFELTLRNLGDGCVWLLAVRGQPRWLFNFHIDTVPAAATWQREPLILSVEGDRAYGLGAADIKGATACMLSASADTRGDLALLFSSDEEAGSSRCIHDFLRERHGFEGVVVAEPTRAEAVLAHRGIATATIRFRGVSGHASSGEARGRSAIHRAVGWAARALDHAAGLDCQRYRNLHGMPFNIGRVEGGIKANMVASAASMQFGIRTLPGQDGAAELEQLRMLADPAEVAAFERGFLAPGLPALVAGSSERTVALARALDLPPGEAVDFWTEAALFAAAGVPALVYGPGDIAQAHTADEWVALPQLAKVAKVYGRLCR